MARGYRPCSTPGCPELVPGGGHCPEHDREGRRERNARRGSFHERGYDAEYIRNRKLVLREETHCGRCRAPVDKSLRFPHPMSPTVGHVRPRSLGGTNGRDNLRLEHLRCNSSAQARS